MHNKDIQHAAGYLRVDCGNVDGPGMAVACRDLAVECLEREMKRVLVRATSSDPEGHRALRNALTAMLLAGIPTGFRLALVADEPRVWALFADLERELLSLKVLARAFVRESDAVDWLQVPAPARMIPAVHS